MTTELEQRTWFYIRDRKKIGPVLWTNLRDLAAGGQLRPADMVLPGGATHWLQALSVEGLFPLPNTQASQRPPPLPTEGTVSLPVNQLPTFAQRPEAAAGVTYSHAAMTQWSGAAPTLPTIPGYTLVGELGRGGMGVVYKAEQTKLKRLVALKMVLGGAVAGAQQFERFRAEAEAVARLQHPNIVQIYEVGEHDGLPFFSLEYCAGGSLAQRMDGTPLAAREAAGMVETLSRAMHAAHERNIVHRDLKPANILLAADGTPKITDFGLAKKMDATEVLTQSGAVMGTPSYMAPEQALGKSRDLGPSADIYALGALLYELLTGRPPFKGATAMDTMLQVASDEPVPPSRLQPKLPPDLETICLKCLEKSTSRRYPTAQALADDLHRYLAGEPIQARPAGRVERCWKWARRRPAVAALLAVSALALLSILAFILYFTVQLGRERNAAVAEKAKAEAEKGKAEKEKAKAEKERERAEENAAEAKRQEEKTKRQEQLTDKERQRAEEKAADARRDLDKSRRSLLTAQLWRVAGLLEREPMEALALLEDREACPEDLRDFAWRYYRSLYTQWRPFILSGHRGSIGSVTVRRDGKIMASAAGGVDASIKLWDLETRKEIATLRDHKGDVNCVAFSPDGTLLASGGDDKSVKLWDVDKKQVIVSLNKHTGPVNYLAFSPDGSWLVSSSMLFDPNAKVPDERYKKGEVHLWNVADRKHEKLLSSLPGTGIMTVSFAPDGKTVAFGTTHNSNMHLVDVDTGKESDKPYSHGAGWVYRVAYSPDGQTVAWSTAQQAIFLLDVVGKKTRLTLRGHQSDVNGLAWSPDGKTLATGSSDGVVKLWNAATGMERLTLRGGVGGIENLAFTPDGNTLVVAHRSPQIVLWDLVPRTSWATYATNRGYTAVTLSQDGQTLAASVARERNLRLRNLSSGKERTVNLDSGSGTVLAFAPKGSLVAVGMHGWAEGKNFSLKTPLPTGECQIWDTNGDKKVATLKTKTERAITAVAFTLDGRWLITGDTGGQLLLWDVADPEKPKESVLLGSHVGAVSALTLCADGRTLATSGADNAIKLWDLAERREQKTLKGHVRLVKGLAFLDKKGEYLASSGLDRSVRSWDVAAGTERFRLPPQPNDIHALAVSKDGNTLALACQDRTIKLWDIPSRQLRAVLPGHTREVNAVTFSHDGKLLLSASAPISSWFVTSGEIKIWKADE